MEEELPYPLLEKLSSRSIAGLQKQHKKTTTGEVFDSRTTNRGRVRLKLFIDYGIAALR